MGLPFLTTTTHSDNDLRHDSTPGQGDRDLQYTVDEGVNSSKVTYQEASGAPIENDSPLGYSVNWLTVIFLNLSKMIGTGVFSTRWLLSSFFSFLAD